MNIINGSSQQYVDLVQQATRRNTVTQVVDAKQNGTRVDFEQVQSSNQQIRETARETGVELYSQSLTKQAFETYVNTSSNMASNSTNTDNNSSNVYTFDPKEVNDTLQSAQKRAVGVALYENLEGLNKSTDEATVNSSTLNVNVFA